MKIRSLAVSKQPVWFDVPGERLEKFVIRAKKRFWPNGSRGVALFQFEFLDAVDAETLAAHRITHSGLGYYVYLQDGPGDMLEQTVSLPPVGIKRVGLRTWSAPEPVVLEDIEVEAVGGAISSEHSVEAGLVLRDLASFENLRDSPDLLGLNLMTSQPECSGRCHSIAQHWYFTMDAVARRYPDDDAGRTNAMYANAEGEPIPVTVFHSQPSMLRIPTSIDAYFDQIGDKSRNMVRKAQRLGYVYREVDPNQYLDDVLAIRTSNPLRQGKPIPAYFKVRPTHVIDEPFQSNCAYHGEAFYGIFKSEKLVAYATIFWYGELGQVNHILGHADHLNEGVMNLLMYELVGQVIQHRPWARAINYLYQGNSRANGGLSLFKKSIGFGPETVLVTQSSANLQAHLPKHEAEAAVEQSTAPSARKALRAETSKAVRAAIGADNFIRLDRVKDRHSAVNAALEALGENQVELKTIRYRAAADEVLESDFDAAAHAVVFDELTFENYQDFLSAQLKGLRKRVPKESFLIFDFKRAPDQDYVMRNEGLARFIPTALASPGRSLNQSLIDYLSKRFKSLDMTMDDVKLGFKGSDYVVSGLIDYGHKPSYRDFDSLLVLRKIR